jgi:DNA-binding LytR/AlgR family response regulator
MSDLQSVRSETAAARVYAIKKRIIVRRGKSFIPVLAKDIALCYTFGKVTFVQLFNGSKYLCDNHLNDLMLVLDRSVFFRVNRSTILNIEVIREYRAIAYSKISIDILPLNQAFNNVVVSQFTAPAFRKWIESQ